MQVEAISFLRCPECRGTLSPSDLFVTTHPESRWTTPQIEDGNLNCDRCSRTFKIVCGVACLLPDDIRESVLVMVGRGSPSTSKAS